MRYVLGNVFGYGLMYHSTVGSILMILVYAIADILTIIGAITVIRWWIHRKKNK